MTWWQGLIGAALTLLGTYITARYALKSSSHAVDKSAEVQHEQNAIQGYADLTADLRADLDRLRADVTRLTESHESLREHVQTLEKQRIRDKRLIKDLIILARRLRDELRKNGIPIPEIEAGIDLDAPTYD